MEPENPQPVSPSAPDFRSRDNPGWLAPDDSGPDMVPYRGLRWIFIGPGGLRAGWSALLFLVLTFVFLVLLSSVSTRIVKALHLQLGQFTAGSTILQEGLFFLALLGAAAVVAALEQRRILDYNLTGPRRLPRFFTGLLAGFLALSVLVGAMAQGGWLRFGPASLSGAQILHFAALWAIAFLLVGLCEEGSFRCFLQSTFTRGLNLGWSLAVVGAVCLFCLLNPKVNGAAGVYAMALLGLVPILVLHRRRAPGSGFWQAAWVSSTIFGFIHTGNTGESWIGIFAAAFIGFVFCVSIRVTGSAWWAIGCHASWDWAETYFYGTADSGLAPRGHYLTTSPAGNALLSGGASGPEGSLLVLPVILLLLLALLVLYARRQPVAPALPQQTPAI